MPSSAKYRSVSLRNSVEIRVSGGISFALFAGCSFGTARTTFVPWPVPDLRVRERREHLDVGLGLGDPVLAGDPEVEQPVLHVERDLLRAQDRDALDAIVVDVPW